MFGRKYSGWTVDVLEPTIIDNRIPGYLGMAAIGDVLHFLSSCMSLVVVGGTGCAVHDLNCLRARITGDGVRGKRGI